jgi:hypothetical protein
MLSQEEISAIKQQGNEIAKGMKPFYDALNVLDSAMGGSGGNSGSSNATYTAGSSVPIVNNFYTTIESGVFMGDEDQARECALFFNKYVLEDQARA